MLLGRLRIRARLTLLVVVPLIAMISLTTAAILGPVADATRANTTAAKVREARLAGTLVRALQEERLLSVGLLMGQSTRTDLLLAQAATDEAAAPMVGLGLADINAVVPNVPLPVMRGGVAAGTQTPAQVITYYGALASATIESLRMLDVVESDGPQGRQVLALDAVMRANEGFALILVAMGAANTPDILPVYINGLAALQPAGTRLTQYMSPEQAALYVTVIASFDTRLGRNFAYRLLTNPGSALLNLQSPPAFPDLVTLTGSGRLVETKILGDALVQAESSAETKNLLAASFLGFALFTVVLAAVLGNAVGRSVIVPIVRLTRSADRVAGLAESELVRVTDDDSPEAAPVRIEAIEVTGRDELSDFARSFGRVAETAARLVERQVASRRNVALMFRHVGRRTQNLVGRQISLIDKLESEETEPTRLGELYRLDHISSRLRRSASSLVVLSGATSSDEHVAPVAIDDVVRLGLAEIEDYTRVDIDVSTPLRVAPALINDLVLLLAELMENATGFSPPGTRVVVAAQSTPDGVRVDVIDHGLGMSPDQMAAENARMTRRERLDLAPTEVLGLFVVGRLARRHGLYVGLSATEGGGVTASVEIPVRLLTQRAVAPAVPLGARAGQSLGPSGPSSSSGPSGPSSPRAIAADPIALDRAARTMRELRPWNAFDTPSRTATEVRPVDVRTTAPTIPAQRGAPSAPDAGPTAPLPTVPAPALANLNRRVPGATLQSLESQGPTRPAPMATPSADDARETLAQFESGVARAMRDMDRDEGNQ